MLRDPRDGAANPLIQAKLTEHILLRRVLKRLVICIPHTVYPDGMTQRGIGFIPVVLGVPVISVIQAVYHRIE